METGQVQQKNLDFSIALKYLKAGYKVSREGWNGNGMFIEAQFPDKHSKMSLPYIYIKNADDELVPWVASIGDLFAEDWVTIN